jgi:hypothetical protein
MPYSQTLIEHRANPQRYGVAFVGQVCLVVKAVLPTSGNMEMKKDG